MNSNGPKILEPRQTADGVVPRPYLGPRDGSSAFSGVMGASQKVSMPPVQHRVPKIKDLGPAIKVKTPDIDVTVQDLPERVTPKLETYTVRKGDTLSEIASRCKVSVGEMAATNNMNKDDILSVGRELKIPAGGIKPKAAPAAPKAEPRWHVVDKGEILGRIANKYDVSISQLKKWNKRTNDIIYKGEKLAVNAAAAAKVKSGPQTARSRKVKRDIPVSGVYEVKKGDSWWRIAHQFRGLNSIKLREINAPTTTLHPGDTIYLTREARATGAGDAREEITGAALPANNRYQVEKGDSWWAISRRFGVPESKLRRDNPEVSDPLMPGTTLIIQRNDPTQTRPQRTRDEGEVAGGNPRPPVAKVAKVATVNLVELPHLVDQEHDTLQGIAELYESKVEWILDANDGLGGNNDLRSMKEIRVPVESLENPGGN